MSKKLSILKFEIISSIFIIITGTILHFTYSWSNNNHLIGTFSAINESTWEHLKLIFFPMLITTIIGHILYKDNFPNYICIKTKGILLALSFIIVFFYTYTGIIGSNITFLNISSFFIAILLGEYYTYKKLKSNTFCNNKIALIILIILFICFIIFTFSPPHIGLFKDPLTNTFGITTK